MYLGVLNNVFYCVIFVTISNRNKVVTALSIMFTLLGNDSGAVLRIGASNVCVTSLFGGNSRVLVLKLGNNLFCGIFGF